MSKPQGSPDYLGTNWSFETFQYFQNLIFSSLRMFQFQDLRTLKDMLDRFKL